MMPLSCRLQCGKMRAIISIFNYHICRGSEEQTKKCEANGKESDGETKVIKTIL